MIKIIWMTIWFSFMIHQELHFIWSHHLHARENFSGFMFACHPVAWCTGAGPGQMVAALCLPLLGRTRMSSEGKQLKAGREKYFAQFVQNLICRNQQMKLYRALRAHLLIAAYWTTAKRIVTGAGSKFGSPTWNPLLLNPRCVVGRDQSEYKIKNCSDKSTF